MFWKFPNYCLEESILVGHDESEHRSNGTGCVEPIAQHHDPGDSDDRSDPDSQILNDAQFTFQ